MAVRNRLQVADLMEVIDTLNEHAFLLKKGNQMYQLQTSTYSQYR